MSLITRCPACGTMFKVVPDQLRISDGWVRCGQCSEVFDASAHLQDESLTAAPGQATPSVSRSSDAGWPMGRDIPGELEEPLDEPVNEPQRPAGPMPQAEARAEPDAVAVGDAAARWSGSGLEPHFDPDPLSSFGVEPFLVPEEPADTSAADAPVSVISADESAPVPASEFLNEPELTASPLPEPDPALPQVSFVRDAERNAFWRRPRIRRLMVGLCVALLVVLALQVVVHERDRIAAATPRTRPLLLALCAALRCAVAPLRQIESIAIDSSSFRKIRDDVYQLNLTIKNGAPVALAMPGIELTLTDTQDQPVLRRILSPADLGAAAVLAAGGEWTGSIPMGVTDSASAARIAGYRVLAFYP